MADETPPEPLTPPECDLRDLDGFMLNVERLLASELWALSTGEEFKAAIGLWARAWKQTPAASLPADERVLASFASMPLPRFRKARAMVMRGFVQCSDGRFYHRVLAAEALRAWERKKAYEVRREAERRRLDEWRKKRRRTPSETPDETRFVAEDTIRDRDDSYSVPNGTGADAPEDIAKVVFRQGLAWLQKSTGKSTDSCRTLLGKWRRDHGDEALISVLGRAQRHGPVDAIPWIEAAFRETAKREPAKSGFNF